MADINELDSVQTNQNLTIILNDIEATMAKVTNILGNDSRWDGLKTFLRRSRDEAATQIGLTKNSDGTWSQP